MLVDRADRYLYPFGGAFAYQHIVGPAHIPHDSLIHLVSGDLYRIGYDYPPERDDRDVGRTAADVDDHSAGGTRNVKSGPYRRGDRLLYEVGLPRARLIGGGDDRPFLDLGDPRGNADHDLRLEEHIPAGAADKILKHFQRDLVLAYDALTQRADRNDIAGSPSEHLLRLAPDLKYLIRRGIYRHDRGFPEYDALALHIDKHRRGTKVNTYIISEKGFQFLEHFCLRSHKFSFTVYYTLFPAKMQHNKKSFCMTRKMSENLLTNRGHPFYNNKDIFEFYGGEYAKTRF